MVSKSGNHKLRINRLRNIEDGWSNKLKQGVKQLTFVISCDTEISQRLTEYVLWFLERVVESTMYLRGPKCHKKKKKTNRNMAGSTSEWQGAKQKECTMDH